MVENLWKKAVAYETLLSRFMPQIDDEGLSAIQESLLMVNALFGHWDIFHLHE